MSDIARLLTLDAGEELNIGIAELSGWNVVCDGDVVWIEGDNADDMHTTNALPDVAHDLNVAWSSLFDTLPFKFTPRLVRMIAPRGDFLTYHYKGSILAVGEGEDYEAYADTPALAVDRVWLTAVQAGVIEVVGKR